jgi:hypothetical protein
MNARFNDEAKEFGRKKREHRGRWKTFVDIGVKEDKKVYFMPMHADVSSAAFCAENESGNERKR